MRVKLTSKLRDVDTKFTPNIIKTKFDTTAFLKERIPSYFLDEKYKQLVFFLEAFFEWLSGQGNPQYIIRNLLNYRNIDYTVREFVDIFFRKYFSGFPTDVLVDKRLLIKHSNDFSSTKGTEAAFKLLFKILYNEDVELYYPGKYLFNTSDGDWQQKTICKITPDDSGLSTEDIYTSRIIGYRIRGTVSGCEAKIDNILSYSVAGKRIAELTISEVNGVFDFSEPVIIYTGDLNKPSELIQYRGMRIVNIPSIAGYIDRGAGFLEDYSVVVDNPEHPNEVDYQSIIKIERVGSDKITSLVIENGGLNYSVGDRVCAYDKNLLNENFVAYVSAVNYVGMIEEIKIRNAGFGFQSTPEIKVESGLGSGAIIKAVSPNAGQIKSLSFYEIGSFFEKSGVVTMKSPATDGTGRDAEIYLTPATIGMTEGRFHNYTSHTSNVSIKLQDSGAYQKLSYIVRSGVNYSDFVDIVKKLVHPAGYNLVGEYFIQLNIYLGLYGGQANTKLNDTKYKNLTIRLDSHLVKLLMRVYGFWIKKPLYLMDKTAEIDHRTSGFQLWDLDKFKLYFNDTPVLPIFGSVKIVDMFTRPGSKYWLHRAYPLSFTADIKTVKTRKSER